MTLPPDSVDPLDEAATAVVDGVATAEDRALLAAAPDGDDRVAAHRRMAAMVGTAPAQPDASAMEDAVQAALAAYDDRGADVHVLAPVPARRPSARWLAPVAAVAAALLLVAGIAGTLRSTRDASQKFSSVGSAIAGDAAAPLAEAPSRPPQAQASELGQGVAAGSGAAPPPLDGGDVGKIQDPADLAQRISEALEGASSNPNTVRAGAPKADTAACIGRASAVAPVPLGLLRYSAVGSYQGTRVIILAYDRTDTPAKILLLLHAKTCDVVTDQDF